MSTQLSPALAQKATPIVQKWDGFLAKIGARVQEVLSEADAGLDQLIAQHALDHGPMGAAFTALQSRFHGLGTKLDEAWEKVDQEWSDLVDELDDPNERDLNALGDAWEEMWAKREALRASLERHHATIETRKNADWSRHLRDLAAREMEQGVRCSQCGTPMQVLDQSGASQQRCPSCSAVNDVRPGTASALFYQGLGAHALAHEGAFGEWIAEQDAKAAFDRFRHPTAYDHWVWLQAARGYWTRYYELATQIHPAMAPQGIEAAVEGRMAHYTNWDQGVDVQQREYFGKLLDASSRGDAAALSQIAQSRPHHVDLDDCADCLVEHAHLQGAALVFGIKHAQDGEDEPKARWVAEQVAERRRALRS